MREEIRELENQIALKNQEAEKITLKIHRLEGENDRMKTNFVCMHKHGAL